MSSNISSVKGTISPNAELYGQINGVIRTLIENDYNSLKNLPSINDIVLKGNLTLEKLGISDIILKNNITEFPNIGNEKNVYIAKEENKTYRWDDENLKYYCIGSDYNDIKIINGGNADG